MSQITTHVLDLTKGRPAKDVKVVLEFYSNQSTWEELGRGETDLDGRLKTLLSSKKELKSGIYRLKFNTLEYFNANQIQGFYPEVNIVFEIRDPKSHYHVPLLLSPFGYSTYRGS